MRTNVWVALVFWLAISTPTVAGQGLDHSVSAPITPSLQREAARLAEEQPVPKSAVDEWAAVRRLPAGSQLSIRRRGNKMLRGRLVRTGEEAVTVVNWDLSGLTEHAKETVLSIALEHPAYFGSPTNERFQRDGILIEPNGVFAGGHRLGALADIVETIPRLEIIEVEAQVRKRGSWIGLAEGLGAGISVTWLLYRSELWNPGLLVTPPVVGAFAGYMLGGRSTAGAVYRAP
jgi:hypothetical protein